MDLKANFKSEMAKVCWAIDKAQWYFWKEKCETVPANCIIFFSCSQIDCPFLNFKFVYTQESLKNLNIELTHKNSKLH